MDYEIKTEGKFKYIETGGKGAPILLLHGLFGALSNFNGILSYFKSKHNVVVPILPIYELPLIKVSLSGLVDHVEAFMQYKDFENAHVVGNSLGGHITLIYALRNSDRMKSMVLTGSSGLFENAMGTSFPKRGDYQFIKKKTESTFYDPKVATKELVDEIFTIVNDRSRAIRVLYIAKSAIRHNMEEKLQEINTPTLLIWGKQDDITPPFVAEKFHELLPNSELKWIDKCKHAPMMEHPDAFNKLLEAFLQKLEMASV